METRPLSTVIAEHRFFAGAPTEYLTLLGGCARNERFKAGQYLCKEGDEATRFFIIRDGHVAIETHSPGRDTIVVQTSSTDDIVGVSWLMPPYRCQFDARAVEDVRAISFDATCLRGKCDADPALGYDLLKRFSAELVRRMGDARAQAMDLFQAPPSRGTTRLIRPGTSERP